MPPDTATIARGSMRGRRREARSALVGISHNR
jgi:hypothetical protein